MDDTGERRRQGESKKWRYGKKEKQEGVDL